MLSLGGREAGKAAHKDEIDSLLTTHCGWSVGGWVGATKGGSVIGIV